MVVAPAVVRSATARLERPAEIGQRERRDPGVDAPELERRVEGVERLARLLEQIPLLVALAAVGVEAAEPAEEDLASDRELGVQADDARDLEELIADRGLGKRLGQRGAGHRRFEDRIQRDRGI